MFVIPSIPIPTDFSRSEAALIGQALNTWERDGFQRIELAPQQRERNSTDARMIEEILRDVHAPVQVAGRLDTNDEIDGALAAGAEFIVLGPRALDEPDWLQAVAGRFPDQLLVSTPARERRTRTRGAVRTLPLDLRDLASDLSATRLAGLIVTFTGDAEIGHAELALLEDIVEGVDFPVMVAGGSPTLTTLRDLEFRGVTAVIMDVAHLSAGFDGQELARNFAD